MPGLTEISEIGRLPNRYYGFDALRASMLLLGVVFHLAAPYTDFILPGYYVTDERSRLLQAVLTSHYFRMPVFFVLCGFFSALQWERGGTREFLSIRSKRIGLVWLTSLAVLSPVMTVVSVYNHFASKGGHALRLTWSAITSLQIDPNWLQKAPIHLWFLEYLMLFCMAAALILSLAQRFLPFFLPFMDRCTEKAIRWRFRIVVLAIPTAATLWHMPFAVMPYPTSLVPWLGVSLTYGWCYAVGWLIYRRRDLLSTLAGTAQVEKAAAPVLFVACLVLIRRRYNLGFETSAPVLDIAIVSSMALFIWATIIALIAAVHQIRPRKWLPYLADSSYWIYLMHYPFAISLPAVLGHWSISPVIKVALSAAFICVLLLVTYDQFVRYTVIGRALNGVRSRTPERAAAQGMLVSS